MLPKPKDYRAYPKFRHNLWIVDENAKTAELTVSHSKFEVSVEHANKFLQMRTFCTGHNTLEQVAEKSGMALSDVSEVVDSLAAAEILHRNIRDLDSLAEEEIRDGLVAACRIWSEQLAMTYIGSAALSCKVPRKAAIGWLLETYHYIKAFPDALRVAAAHADGRLRELLTEYARQETGHERFVLETLTRIGFRPEEIESAIPLVSTKLIDMLMREMFAMEPVSALLVAAVIEVQDSDPEQMQGIRAQFHEHYGFPDDALDPLFTHARIDSEFGHGRLLEQNLDLLGSLNRRNLHDIVNRLHDLKHAFDVQSLEIRDYYRERPGNYIPRQYVSFFAI